MKNKITSIVLILLSAAYLSPIITMQVGVYDEGVILAGADRILKGQRPYIDFWSLYPPGQFYTLAFLFDTFGSSIFVERLYDISVKVLIPLFTFLILKRLSFSTSVAVIFWASSLFWIGLTLAPGYPVYPSMLLIFVSVYCLLIFLENSKNSYLIFCALLIVSSALFRHDLGGMAATVTLIIVILKKLKEKNIAWTSVFYFISTIAIGGITVLIYFAVTSDIHIMFAQLILLPAELLPKYRWLPYPSLASGKAAIPFYLFPIAALTGLLVSFATFVKYKRFDNSSYILLFFSILGCMLLNQASVRSDTTHLLPLALTAMVSVPLLFSALYRNITQENHPIFTISNRKKFKFIRAKLSNLSPKSQLSIYLLLLIVFIVPVSKSIYKTMQSLPAKSLRSAIARAGYANLPKDLQDVILYIYRNTSKNDYLYVGVKNHDQFIIDDVIIYYLSARNYATKYHELHPGITNTLDVQKKMIEELKDTNTKTVILAPRYWREPNLTSVDPKIDLLDNYISQNFILKIKFGIYEVWLKKT